MSQRTFQNLQTALADFVNEGYREQNYFISLLAGEIRSALTEDELREFAEALKIKNEPIEL